MAPQNAVAVGCLDTGVDAKHSALSGRIEQFRLFNPDGFSWQDDQPTDASWHGTHVAGLIAGYKGEETGPDTRLICGAVIERGAILARILLGLDWLAGTGITVANLSLGIPGPTPVFRTMVRVLAAKDVLVTAPIGNRGAGAALAPGAYPEVLSVGAADSDGRAAKFSGSLNDPVTKLCFKPDILAPGVGLVSSVPGGGFEARSGTSMASAVAAGMAAALRTAFPLATAAAVARALCESARPLHPEQQHRARYGLARMDEAMSRLRERIGESAPRRPETETFPRFIDARLTDRLAQGSETSDQDAILEFDDDNTCLAFEREIGAPLDLARRFVKLRHAPIAIVRAPSDLLRRKLASNAFRVASACDVDRWPLFDRGGM